MTAYIHSKKINKKSHEKGIAVLSFLIILSVVSLGLLYIVQTNSLVDCSYRIREQRSNLKKLDKENQSLEIAINQWQSPGRLKEMVGSLNMVKAEQVSYLEIVRPVALNQ